jgi:hypothetical protein
MRPVIAPAATQPTAFVAVARRMDRVDARAMTTMRLRLSFLV